MLNSFISFPSVNGCLKYLEWVGCKDLAGKFTEIKKNSCCTFKNTLILLDDLHILDGSK